MWRVASRLGEVVLLCRGLSKASDPFAGIGVIVMCQGLNPRDGGDPDVLIWRLPARPSEDEVQDSLVEAFPWGRDVLKGLDSEGSGAFL